MAIIVMMLSRNNSFHAKAVDRFHLYDFCRTAALELADRGVRVNAVSDEKC